MDAAGFRAYMPAFKDAQAWPTADISAALTKSAVYLGATEWTDAGGSNVFDEATANWVADRLVTDKLIASNPLASATGTETMKQVGTVMLQRDARIVLAMMEDPYLRTSYGRQYKYLVRLYFGGYTLAAPAC